MSDKLEAEGGMIRSLLGHSLINLSSEDLILLVRQETFLYSICALKDEGWNKLELIYFSDKLEVLESLFLTYRLSASARSHRTIGLQVQIACGSLPLSTFNIFPNSKNLEEILEVEHEITFTTP